MTDLATVTHMPKRRIARPFWFAAGSLSLLLGMIGVVLPVLPTTCFVLFAAFAYSKSSPRMALYLERHRVFGPIIVDWRTHGAIAPRFKAMAVATMVAVLAVGIVMGLSATVVAIQAMCIAAAATYILSRPSGPRKEPARNERGERFGQSYAHGGAH